MNSEPVSISTLMNAVMMPMARKAPLHADRAAAIGAAAAPVDADLLTALPPHASPLHAIVSCLLHLSCLLYLWRIYCICGGRKRGRGLRAADRTECSGRQAAWA